MVRLTPPLSRPSLSPARRGLYVASHTDTHFDGWEAFVVPAPRFARSLYLPLWWPRSCCGRGNRRRGVA